MWPDPSLPLPHSVYLNLLLHRHKPLPDKPLAHSPIFHSSLSLSLLSFSFFVLFNLRLFIYLSLCSIFVWHCFFSSFDLRFINFNSQSSRPTSQLVQHINIPVSLYIFLFHTPSLLLSIKLLPEKNTKRPNLSKPSIFFLWLQI